MPARETLEQAGARHLQALLIDAKDGLALHQMIKCYSAAVRENPNKADAISSVLDQAGRHLCAAAMQSQALISAQTDEERLRFGVESISRIHRLYSQGYVGIEDVGYWKHNILRLEKQLELVLVAYIRLLKMTPAAVKDYSHHLMVDFRNLWRPEHYILLDEILKVLNSGGHEVQGKANLLPSEVVKLKKDLRD